MIYPVDYGYLKNTASMDGGGIDIWVGTQADLRLNGIICTIDLMKRDSEIKLLLGCTEEEMEAICRIHNESQYMKGILLPAPEACAYSHLVRRIRLLACR